MASQPLGADAGELVFQEKGSDYRRDVLQPKTQLGHNLSAIWGTPAMIAAPSSARTGHSFRKLLFQLFREEHALQPPEAAIIKKPTDHIIRDLVGARLVEFTPGSEFEPFIEPIHRGHHAGADKRRGPQH